METTGERGRVTVNMALDRTEWRRSTLEELGWPL